MSANQSSFALFTSVDKTTKQPPTLFEKLFPTLAGKPARKVHDKITKREVTFLLRSLATLVDSGVSLPKALLALSQEKAMERARVTLLDLERRLESGASFSAAIAAHPAIFDRITVNQVKVGERSGTLAATLDHIAMQREKAGKLKSEVRKKLAYPCLLMVVGACVITFLLTYVVPVFEETYSSANVPLPGVTQTLIWVGFVAKSYGLYLALGIVAAVLGVRQLRQHETSALWMDRNLLKLPLVGEWIRDIAILELVDVLANLMGSGYTLTDSLAEAQETVSNRAVKLCVKDLCAAVERGERFSRSVEAHSDLFPPMVSQLVIVGERTGNLLNAARHIQKHLEGEVERKATAMVGVIEPTLTLSLSAAVAVILLAIYLPMFDMINTVN
ncbi:MAG: type II secretion system F family protein [Planctomycetales bacterium]|nr:type II secretion system F family protein [Planctomycetales bacterium]